MPVTELVLFTTTAGAVTPAYRAAIARAIEVQDAWCAANLAAMPRGPAARGVAMFQQVEDAAVTLLTAHWDSVAQHGEWIASEANKDVFPTIQGFLDMARMVYFHVEGVAAFADREDADGAVAALEAPFVGVVRFSVASEMKAEFERVFAGVRAVFDAYAWPFVHRGGWRIEKEGGGEEYVLIGGWESVEGAQQFEKQEGFRKFDEAIKTVVTGMDSKHYKRFL
ncbi:hypothetical protein BJ170DRAFT_680102 [Xylariales sp. AK1849]|nr:hypothetical protein BJ170DRAFT_680102 [Xylariales sp. AK1849]